MFISTDNGTVRNIVGDRAALRMISEVGFNGIDYTFYAMEPGQDIFELPEEKRYALAMQLREDAEKYGIAFPQSHAPFDYQYGEDRSGKNYQGIVKALQFSGWLGCPQCVIHTLKFPRTEMSDEQSDEINREFLHSFLPKCEEYNVDIGVENLFQYDSKRKYYYGHHGTPESMNAFVDSLESPRYKVCCDLGHASLVGVEAEDFIAGMNADRLTMLHVQDIDYLDDSHTIPYLGKQNWDAIAASLAKIGFRGYMNLEVLHFYEQFPADLLPVALRCAADVARQVAAKVDSLR